MDDVINDDSVEPYDFSLTLSQSQDAKPYYKIEEQESEIVIDETGIPKVGENYVSIADDESDFQVSKRQFFTLPGQATNIEIPLVPELKDGELALVLTWQEGSQVQGNNVEMQNLDLHVMFQASDTVKCQVDHTMRQCNGVRLSADEFSSESKLQQIEAVKFDKVGDFNYMVYASRTKKVEANPNHIQDSPLLATLQIFSPRHQGPVYEVNLPFYTSTIKEKYWIAFCLRGGRGINNNGVTVSDLKALYLDKPDVNKDCYTDNEHIPTIGISQPQSVDAKVVSLDLVEIEWQEPSITGRSPILKYRIFVSEKDKQGTMLNLETADSKTSYRLKIPRSMWGKSYVVTVQAINKNRRMSLISEPAIFTVTNPKAESKKQGELPPAAAAPAAPAFADITGLHAPKVAYDSVNLEWAEVPDASDYKVYWDSGKGKQFAVLLTTTNGKHMAALTPINTNSALGQAALKKNGGNFKFKVSYFSKAQQKESPLSQALPVSIKP